MEAATESANRRIAKCMNQYTSLAKIRTGGSDSYYSSIHSV